MPDSNTSQNISQNNNPKSPIILIDGSSYLFRAFYALPNLTNSQGLPTGAILGVINMLNSLLTQYKPQYMAVIFDTKTKNFRHEIYPAYKANRDQMPEALASQIQPIFDFIKALGIPLIKQEGIEADDLIGTLAHADFINSQSVLISTGDKDMTQLVNQNIKLIDTMKNQVLDSLGVKEKFGVSPEQIIDYLTLMGDSSDNIPGVPGVGPKTAVKWLEQYQSLDLIIKNAEKISGKVGENFRACLNQFDLVKKLVTIDLNIPGLDPQFLNLKSLEIFPQDTQKLINLCELYNFKSWLKNLSPSLPNVPSAPRAVSPTGGETISESNPLKTIDKNYQLILDLRTWENLLLEINQNKYIALDTETTGLDPLQDQLVGISFCIKPNQAFYLPLTHDDLSDELVPQQLKISQIFPGLKSICEDINILKIGHHLKFDIQVLENISLPSPPPPFVGEGRDIKIKFQGPLFDTLLASYVLEAGQTRHNMEVLAQRHLNLKTISYEQVTGKGAKQISFNQVPIDQALLYAAEDADITFQLYQKFLEDLKQLPNLNNLYTQEEIPMLRVLARMESCGVLISPEKLNAQSQELGLAIINLENQVQALAGMNFNLGSPKQLQSVLFEKLNLNPVKKTAKGQISTDEEVLQILAETHEVPKLLLEHRHLIKLKNTYTDKLPTMINPRTGRIHTRYHQALVITGRLSSSEPNLQNIPIKSPQGRKIRQAFIAPENYLILSADYSQIELRIMAHLSQDPGLINAFKNHEDIHKATASEVFNTPKDQVTQEQRRRAKAVNFGLIYGMSAFGLAKQLGIERSLAQEYINIYFARYPGVKNYMDQIKVKAQEQGYVETLFGRRLALPDIHAKNSLTRQGAERAAINAPMQGTAADIIKRAMIHIDSAIQEQNLPLKMTMQVHDELVFEIEKNNLIPMQNLISKLMSEAADLLVPLTVSINTGLNWDEAH